MDTTDHPTSIPTPPKCMHATNRPYHIFTFLMHFLAAAFSSTIALENFFNFIFFKCNNDHLPPPTQQHQLLTNQPLNPSVSFVIK